MPYKDPERQRTYQRTWQRSRRAAVQSCMLNLTQERLQSAEGILDALSDIMKQLMASEIDLVLKSRAVAYVASITLRACETAELERRLQVLEDRVLRGSGNGHKTQN